MSSKLLASNEYFICVTHDSSSTLRAQKDHFEGATRRTLHDNRVIDRCSRVRLLEQRRPSPNVDQRSRESEVFDDTISHRVRHDYAKHNIEHAVLRSTR